MSADPETVLRPQPVPTTLAPSEPDATQPGTTSSPDADAPPGYAIEGELGRGGMGVVYRARQLGLNRPCALKMVLAPGLEIGARRFLAEAEAVAAIRHPQVVQVYDFGQTRVGPFLAMEFCTGGTLDDRLKAGRFTPAEAVGLLAGLAEAVAAAHAQEIVHRDLKPSNVLFDADGVAKVADFGLAKRVGGADLTRTQAVMGSPAYMSPEQARGETRFAGPQADVWSLGVMLYECLTGRRPFVADSSYTLLQRVIDTEPPRLRAIDSKLPRELEVICATCLAKVPAERYAHAGALAADLRNHLAGRPLAARPTPLSRQLLLFYRRNRTLAVTTAGVVLLLTAGLAAAVYYSTRLNQANHDLGKAKAQQEQLVKDFVAEVRGSPLLDYNQKVRLVDDFLKHHPEYDIDDLRQDLRAGFAPATGAGGAATITPNMLGD